MGHLVPDCPNRGTRDDSGINLKRAFGSFVGMTGDRDVPSPVLTTTPKQEIVQYSDFNMSHVPVVIWLSLLVFVEQFLFLGVIGLRCQVQNTIVLLGLRRNQSQFHLLLQHSNVHVGQCGSQRTVRSRPRFFTHRQFAAL